MESDNEPNPMNTTTPEGEDEREPETSDSTEQRGTTPEEFRSFSSTTVETISGGEFPRELEGDEAELEAAMETAILESVRGLPEELAEKLRTVDPAPLIERANGLLAQIQGEVDPKKRANLQVELIFQYITLISRVQNGGDKGFIPSVAREVDGLDCSLSAWALKEKLTSSDVPDLQFEFGYPYDHAVGIVTVADGRRLYVDAQNGFIFDIETQQVWDEAFPDTAYPIYEVTDSRRLTGTIPHEGEVTLTRPEGNDYLPKYFGVQESGLIHTVDNLGMFVSGESPTHDTNTAARFRDRLHNDPAEWERFQQFVDRIDGGEVIQETKFRELSQHHRDEFDIQKVQDTLSQLSSK